MKKINISNVYLTELANQYVKGEEAVYFVTSQYEKVYQYEGNRRTDKVIAHKGWFPQNGNNPFIVKFEGENEPELFKFMSKIEFENLRAIEVKNNIYFKADGMKVME
ncbi:hypothetical protein QPJ54_000438 [Listeria monocytogenes]|nr:hypothetical protein [Listeria monocytogenes]EHC5236746.1 hypothetical protein [Listeria monocytogenes serotype 1/2a]EAG5667738.1 hypothetical protein [Listeria monocytogenes]ECC2753942.1 hypothetical protein [Listeria monocytogenes]EHC6019624.1 hypothetical protein [Listeria monocytogenes serotype 1/2a]